MFVNSKQIETNYKPSFTDVQAFASYQINDKLNVDFLGNFSLNNYNYTPISRRTRFGTLVDPIELIVFYSGQEKDKYITSFGAFKADYKLNDEITLNATASLYTTQEEEYFDILASYNLGEVNSNLGSEKFWSSRIFYRNWLTTKSCSERFRCLNYQFTIERNL